MYNQQNQQYQGTEMVKQPVMQYPQQPVYQQQQQQYPQQGGYPQTYPQQGGYPQQQQAPYNQNYPQQQQHQQFYDNHGQNFQQPFFGWDTLTNLEGVYVEKKLDVLEAITGCEIENSYYVWNMNVDGSKGHDLLFKVKENSSWWGRNCLPGHCRPFTLKMKDRVNGQQVFMEAERECACTFLCCNRPHLDIYKKDQGFKGRLVNPFDPCNMNILIKDQNDAQKFAIRANACSCYFFLRAALPCQDCQQFEYLVYNANDQAIGNMKRLFSGCTCEQYYMYYSIAFPKPCTNDDKALLIMACVFMDFSYFERSQADQNGDGVPN